jgi:hypothetical protein
MTEFSGAVKAVGERFADVDGGDYVPDEERLGQADTVGPCVERFVVGELDPSRELSAARTPFGGSPPSLAEKLGRKLEGADDQTLSGAKDAVRSALAVGYIFHGPIELDNGIKYCAGRGAEEIWDFWAAGCREMLEETGMPKANASAVRNAGANQLVADLKKLGLTKFLGGSKLNQLGMTYAQAGVLLRMTQTDTICDEDFAETVARVRERPERSWKWEDYPID